MGRLAGLTTAWLTSAEHYFWDYPRRVEVVDLTAGPEPGSTYARLSVDESQPDGPMDLAVRRRDNQPWALPGTAERVDVLVWVLKQGTPAWTGAFQPPHPRPDAWCTLCPSQEEAARVAHGRGTAGCAG